MSPLNLNQTKRSIKIVTEYFRVLTSNTYEYIHEVYYEKLMLTIVSNVIMMMMEPFT